MQVGYSAKISLFYGFSIAKVEEEKRLPNLPEEANRKIINQNFQLLFIFIEWFLHSRSSENTLTLHSI